MVHADRVGDLLQERRLPGLGWRDDEAPLALADRGNEVDHARLERFAPGFHPDHFLG